MRFANGMGAIIKLSGNRRKPYGARVTVGWENGKQKYKYIGYFADQTEALTALLTYNGGEIHEDTHKLTFAEVFYKWIGKAEKTLTEANKRDYVNVFKHAERLHKRRFNTIKSDDLQAVLDDCDKSLSFKKKMKSLFNQMYIYGEERDLCKKNMAKYVTAESNKEVRDGVPFTDVEIEKLWSMKDEFDVKILLTLLYTGTRINELLEITLENLHLDEGYMIGGKKTAAGKNRVIPLSDKIIPLLKDSLSNNKYLFELNGLAIKYHTYRNRFTKVIEKLGTEHHLHDTRHTTISRLHSAGVSETTIKKIVGHSQGGDITAKVYIHKTVDELREAINKI